MYNILFVDLYSWGPVFAVITVIKIILPDEFVGTVFVAIKSLPLPWIINSLAPIFAVITIFTICLEDKLEGNVFL